MLRKIKYKIILVHRTRKQHLSYPACWLKRLLSTAQRQYPLTYIASMSASKISVNKQTTLHSPNKINNDVCKSLSLTHTLRYPAQHNTSSPLTYFSPSQSMRSCCHVHRPSALISHPKIVYTWIQFFLSLYLHINSSAFTRLAYTSI